MIFPPVREEVNKALRVADPDQIKIAEIDVKELQDKYGTTKFGADLKKLLTEIDDFRQGKVEKATDDVVELMKKAQLNFDKEQWLLAGIFARNVIAKGGPNTDQAKAAQKIIAAIPKAKEEAKVRDEWINAKLKTAATFDKNNMPAKSVPIYEEILNKYAKFPKRAEVEKLQEEAKKKAGK